MCKYKSIRAKGVKEENRWRRQAVDGMRGREEEEKIQSGREVPCTLDIFPMWSNRNTTHLCVWKRTNKRCATATCHKPVLLPSNDVQVTSPVSEEAKVISVMVWGALVR